MTFLDKLKEDYPRLNAKKISNSCCPSSYDYEPEGDCPTGDCTSCWNREMPDTEFKQSVANPPTQEEQETWCNAHESGKAEGYEKGLKDAWELAKKVVRSPKLVENAQIFLGKNIVGIERESLLIQFFELTPQEALAKLKAYEDSKIKVGDIIEVNGEKAVVTSFGTDNNAIHVMYFDGIVNSYRNDINCIKKTGKHIDIQSIIEQIRGN